MISPRTPLRGKLPLFGARSAFILVGQGACAPELTDSAFFIAKSLNVERVPQGVGVFLSTDYPVFSTVSVFCPRRTLSLYLSLFIKKERKKEGLEGKTTIHGLRGFFHGSRFCRLIETLKGVGDFALIRGFRGLCFILKTTAYMVVGGHPRPQVLHCASKFLTQKRRFGCVFIFC